MEWWNSIRLRDGALLVGGNYSAFLEAKESTARAEKRQESLENASANLSGCAADKARATKAKAALRPRDDRELAEMNNAAVRPAPNQFLRDNRKPNSHTPRRFYARQPHAFKDIHFSVKSECE